MGQKILPTSLAPKELERPWYKIYKWPIGIMLIIVLIAPFFDSILYRIDPFLYGMFYRDGMIYQPDLSGEPIHYTSDKHYVEFDYYPGFFLDDSLPPDGPVTPIAQLAASVYMKSPENQFSEGIMFISLAIPPGQQNLSLETLLQEKQKEYGTYDYVTMIDEGYYELSNSKAGYLEYLVQDTKNGPRTTKEYFIIRPNNLYVVTFTDIETEYKDSVEHADNFVKSIKFTNNP